MTDHHLPRFTAIDTHDTEHPVFYLDTDAPLSDLASLSTLVLEVIQWRVG